jgi:hypothetical protein
LVQISPKKYLFQCLRAFLVCLSFLDKQKEGDPITAVDQASLITTPQEGSLDQNSSNLKGRGREGMGRMVSSKRGLWSEV